MALTKIKTGGIADNAITNAKMADDAIDSADFADASIDNVHVATGLDAVKLADGTVTNAEFQYINTLSSNAQTQISAKSPTAGNASLVTVGTIGTGVWNAGAVTSSGTVTGVAGTFSGVLTANANLYLGSGSYIYQQGSKVIEMWTSGSNYIYKSYHDKVTFPDCTLGFGIGTDSPVVPLDLGVTTANSQVFHLRTNSNSKIGFGVLSGYGMFQYAPSDVVATAPLFQWGTMSMSDGSTFAPKLTLQTNGKVGIGNSAPATTLDVNGAVTIDTSATDEKLMLKGSTAPYIRWYENTTAKAYIQWHPDGYLNFENQEASTIYKMGTAHVFTGGNVGIGETSPDHQLHITSGTASNPVLKIENTTAHSGNVTNGGILEFKSTDTNGSIPDNNVLGEIQFMGHHKDSPYTEYLYAKVQGVAFDPGNAYGDLRFFTRANTSDFPERMRITHEGKVGIGATAPAAKLDIQSGSGITILFGADVNAITRTDNTRKFARIGAVNFSTDESPVGIMTYDCQADDDARIIIGGGDSQMNAATSISFYTSANATTNTGTVRMTIASDGSITHQGAGGAIKTDSDGSTLSFSKDATNTITSTGNSSVIHIIAESNGVSLANSGTSWGSLSDERLKENWSYFDNALDKINTLTKIGTYNPIDRETKKVDEDCVLTGLSADEIKKILPTAITEDEEGYKILQYQDVFVLMLKSIQELSAKVEALENA